MHTSCITFQLDDLVNTGSIPTPFAELYIAMSRVQRIASRLSGVQVCLTTGLEVLVGNELPTSSSAGSSIDCGLSWSLLQIRTSSSKISCALYVHPYARLGKGVSSV